jgi:CBS domain-containing protein
MEVATTEKDYTTGPIYDKRNPFTQQMEVAMKSYLVKDLMVPLSEYATVSEDATLYEAILSLERAQENFEDKHTRYRHRAILVLDINGQVIGKISQLDALKALEPKYQDMIQGAGSQRFGFTKKFMKSMLDDYNLFANPLDDICRKAGEQNVKLFMSTLTEGEYVPQDATLDVAIHQLVMGHHQSLLVTAGGKIVGILRLTDVFAALFHKMKECFE